MFGRGNANIIKAWYVWLTMKEDICYRNWYQYWGHCCLINDLGAHHSPRAKPEGCEELPRSWMRQQWPKLRYQFLFYHDETKLMMNKQILSIWMLKFVPKLSLVAARLHVYILGSCDLIVSTCSNHCDVTVRFVTLSSNCTLNQNRQQNRDCHSWETDQN